MKLKIGDRVVCMAGLDKRAEKRAGEIVVFEDNLYLIRLDAPHVDAHDADGRFLDNRGWWVHASDVQPEHAWFTVKDSGSRKEFASGMVRDTTEGKIDWHRIADGPMLRRWAEHMTKGAQKHPDVEAGVPNWTLAGGHEERQRFRQSAFRHFMQWNRGDRDEDHASAVFFNICGAEYVKEKLEDRHDAKRAVSEEVRNHHQAVQPNVEAARRRVQALQASAEIRSACGGPRSQVR